MGKEIIFWFCALSGSGLFLIQFFLNLIGSDSESDDNSADGFQWLSKQTITSFLMMFGWVGLAGLKEFGFSVPISVLMAVAAGMSAMLVTGMVFHFARKLRSTGTVFKLEEAIGKEASVYQRIPKDGVGKVSLALQEMTHEIDAISLSGEEIDSFSQVQIVRKKDDATVVVVPIK